MKKKYIIFILIIVLLIIGLIFFMLFFKTPKRNNVPNKDNKVLKTYENNKEESTSGEDEESKENVQQKDNDLEEKIPEQKQPNKDITETKKETPKTNTSNSSNNNEVNNTKSIETEKPSQPVITETTKDEPWEKLGISEYDYYNKPMYSWEKVNFKISDYGSKTATEKACEEYGYSYIEVNDGAFSCNNVLSYSGAYLGEYFKYNSMD